MSEYNYSLAELRLGETIIPCLIFTEREKGLWNCLVENGYKVFFIRHSDEDWGEPATVENYVIVNFYGYIATKDENGIKAIETYIPPNDLSAYICLDDKTNVLNLLGDIYSDSIPS